MNYMRKDRKDDYGILSLQDKILEIAVYIDKFCNENGIDYCLMGGSALGAKRHQGFIPWDDDLDIFMTADNYNKFRDAFEDHGNKEKFYLQEYGLQTNGMVTVPKLRMNGTAYFEELTKDWDIHQGIFVDIFILHNCPDNTLKRLWQCFWAKCAVVKGMSIRNYNRQTGIRKVLLGLSRFLPRKIMVGYALSQVYRFDNKKSSNFCNFLGKALYKRGIYRREWFETTVSTPFESVSLRIPKGLHEFLTERFGNYMIPPSADRIKWEQHASKWSIDRSFKEFCDARPPYIDERNLI